MIETFQMIYDLLYEYWGFFLFNLFVFVLSDIFFKGVIGLWGSWKKLKLLTLIRKKN